MESVFAFETRRKNARLQALEGRVRGAMPSRLIKAFENQVPERALKSLGRRRYQAVELVEVAKNAVAQRIAMLFLI